MALRDADAEAALEHVAEIEKTASFLTNTAAHLVETMKAIAIDLLPVSPEKPVSQDAVDRARHRAVAAIERVLNESLEQTR